MQKVYLGNNVFVDCDFRNSKKCECGVIVYFAKTSTNKTMPIHKTANGYASHFSTCPSAKKFRKK